MALKIENEKIVGTIDDLKKKLTLFEKEQDLEEEIDASAIHFQICIEPHSENILMGQTDNIHWFEL